MSGRFTTFSMDHSAPERGSSESSVESEQPGRDNPVEESDELAAAVDELLTLMAPETSRRLPWATYRVQFNSSCTFERAERAVGYLAKLGISDMYAAPFLQARPGSVHGYDIVDHHSLNSEIGTRANIESLSAALRSNEMGLIADVVPNHMCASPMLNAWWQDVLENGPSSAYASYFDIDWMPLKPDLANKLLLPVLGDQFGKVLEGGQLRVTYEEGSFWLDYYEHRFPISPRSYVLLLAPRIEILRERLPEDAEELLEFYSILTAIKNLPPRTETDIDRLTERRREKEVIKRRLNDLISGSPVIAEFVGENVAWMNGIPGDPASYDPLDELLQEQAYRLSYWRVASDEINYRRFFDINELAAIRTESPEVFNQTHELILDLLDENIVTGLRIDHPDGLYDPQSYLYQLQHEFYRQRCRNAVGRYRLSHPDLDDADALRLEDRLVELWDASARIPGSPLSRPLYIVTEKILATHEPLPHDWPVHGTVGYEFLNAANGLFVDPRGERSISSTFARFTGTSFDFEELTYQCKRLIVRMSMSSEIAVLGHQLDRISERDRTTRDFTLNSLTRVLEEVVAGFHVYRTYVRDGNILERDRHYIEEAVAMARRRNPAMNASVFDFVRDVLLLNSHVDANAEERAAVRQFVGKFQQVTGPIMAKAVEDTAFYRYGRLVSLNEVGGEPQQFGTSIEEFHEVNRSRLPWQTHSMSASSTHDTKRSEDVRARINVLSEIPKEWRDHLQRWARTHRRLKTTVEGADAPDANAEYQLYQTLIGIFPGEIPQGEDRETFINRVQIYMLKVVREAKVHTSWISPAQSYELALEKFVAGVLADDKKRTFLTELKSLADRVAVHGRWNALSQLVLKLGSPGVADFYQGTESWNLTLVDPDNRRPVDFDAAESRIDELLTRMSQAFGTDDPHRIMDFWLNDLSAKSSPSVSVDPVAMATLVDELVSQAENGDIKRFSTLVGLHARRLMPDLWSQGEYYSLNTGGTHSESVIAFAREWGPYRAMIIVPRWTVRLCGLGGQPPLGDVWEDTVVNLPESWQDATSGEWRNLFTQEQLAPRHDEESTTWELPVADVFRQFPVSILVARE